jgi:hypothetical protein
MVPSRASLLPSLVGRRSRPPKQGTSGLHGRGTITRAATSRVGDAITRLSSRSGAGATSAAPSVALHSTNQRAPNKGLKLTSPPGHCRAGSRACLQLNPVLARPLRLENGGA